MLTWELRATGRVQFVGFRRFARTCALRCSLTGWVRNQGDGSVLIEATGDRNKLELFCELLRAGNRFVDVRELRIREQDETVVYDDFTIR
ncbi:MAG TPA: acylphosphatase [Candidatus Syntrophosphaera sp.]|jgi:acylphosphatase|nr:acylphosphatase [Candidatus Syntrophosphaera sp.]